MVINSTGTINNDPQLSLYENNYRKLKTKYRQEFDDNMYKQMAWNSILNMFEYDDRIHMPQIFERILRDTGCCALIKTEISDYTPVFCNIAGGDRYPDGFFKNVICYDLTGKQYNFKNWQTNENVFVFFNNLLGSADNFIDKYAYMLSELDTSITANVLFSRLKPIPIAKDKVTLNRINNVINDLLNGKLKTILQDFAISDLVEGNGGGIDVVNLTHVEDSKYIQFLQNLHDSIISRLYFMMGLSISDNGKQAQISIDELNKSKSASLSIIYSYYKARKVGFEQVKNKTGVELNFDFNKLWKSEVEMQVETEENDEKTYEEKEEKQDVSSHETLKDGDNDDNGE